MAGLPTTGSGLYEVVFVGDDSERIINSFAARLDKRQKRTRRAASNSLKKNPNHFSKVVRIDTANIFYERRRNAACGAALACAITPTAACCKIVEEANSALS